MYALGLRGEALTFWGGVEIVNVELRFNHR
jgi:hypothetical protein